LSIAEAKFIFYKDSNKMPRRKIPAQKNADSERQTTNSRHPTKPVASRSEPI